MHTTFLELERCYAVADYTFRRIWTIWYVDNDWIVEEL